MHKRLIAISKCTNILQFRFGKKRVKTFGAIAFFKIRRGDHAQTVDHINQNVFIEHRVIEVKLWDDERR